MSQSNNAMHGETKAFWDWLEANDGTVINIPDEPMTANELMSASESVLAKTWDTPAENEAWRHLGSTHTCNYNFDAIRHRLAESQQINANDVVAKSLDDLAALLSVFSISINSTPPTITATTTRQPHETTTLQPFATVSGWGASRFGGDNG